MAPVRWASVLGVALLAVGLLPVVVLVVVEYPAWAAATILGAWAGWRSR